MRADTEGGWGMRRWIQSWSYATRSPGNIWGTRSWKRPKQGGGTGEWFFPRDLGGNMALKTP